MLGSITRSLEGAISLRITADHRAAIEAKACRRDMQQALAHSYHDQELAVISALKTVYFMAKKNLMTIFQI